MHTKLVQLSLSAHPGKIAGVSFSSHQQYAGLRFVDAPPEILDHSRDRYQRVPVELPATGLAFRPHGNLLAPSHEVAIAVGSDKHQVYRFDARTGDALPPALAAGARSVAYSQNGSMLAVGGNDGSLRLFTLDGNRAPVQWRSRQVAEAPIVDITFGARGLYGVTANGGIFHWDPEHSTQEQEVRLDYIGGGCSAWDCYAVSAQMSLPFVFFSGAGNKVFAFAPLTGDITPIETDLGAFVRAGSFCALDHDVTVTGAQGVEIWEPAPFRRTFSRTFPEHNVWGARAYGRSQVVVVVTPK